MRNAANIITVQNHKIHKNQPERTYTYTVLKLTVKQVIQSLHNGQSRKTLNYGSQTFCRAIQLGGSVPVLLAYVSVFANKTEKLFLTSISPLKFAVTLRSGSNRQARLEPCHRNPEILKSNQNMGVFTTEEKKCPSFILNLSLRFHSRNLKLRK